MKTILNIALQITANLSIVVEPFMPFTAAKLLAMLRLEPLDWERIGATDLVAAGHRIGTPELLFEKIEDDVIQAQLDKLAATKEANLAAESSQNIDPQKDGISFDDFQRMDIRVSVSYTHLDVYKRQPWCRIMRSPEPFVRVPAMCCRRLCSSESKSSSV